MSTFVLSPNQFELVNDLLQDAIQQYGSRPLERIKLALAIAGGLEPRLTPDDPAQRPEFLFPGLKARAWHEPEQYGFGQQIEAEAEAILDELKTVLRVPGRFQPYRQHRNYFVPDGMWHAFYFRVGSTWFNEHRALCPRTFSILERVPRLAEVAMFSALCPGGHIAPHCGTWNCRVTCHLGLTIPDNCSIRVGKDTRVWQQGKLLMFDDSFEHEAWNGGSETRIVLLFDVWHPDLSDIEVDFLDKFRQSLSVRDGKEMIEQIRKRGSDA